MFFRSKKTEPAAETQSASAVMPPPNLRVPVGAAKAEAPAPAPAPAAAAPPTGTTRAATGAHDAQKAFTQVVALMMKAPEMRSLSLADLEWLVFPPLTANQAVVAEGRMKSGLAAPIGAVLWARVSPEVDRRLAADPSAVPRLSPADWTSGEIPWAVVTAGRADVVEAMIGQLLKGPLAGRSIKVRALAAGGAVHVREIAVAAA